MRTANSIEDRMHEVKSRISVIEWDLNNISNGEMRKKKELELSFLRSELKEMADDHLSTDDA